MEETQGFVARADIYTDWLGWLAILIGLGAVGLAFMAWRAFVEGLAARREAEAEGWRALDLEEAVRTRTRELSDANERLREEAGERAAAEDKLRQIQKLEAVGQLTGGIAHDFNNMLAVIVGGLDLAKRKLHGPRREVEFHLDNAMEGATRAAALTRRLLAFARAEPLLPEAVAPAELVENMLELVDRAIGERITVHTRFADVQWHVWADPTQFENAILNLAVNARDAMGGRGDLNIQVDNVALNEAQIAGLPAGDYVRIRVNDTGSGIAPEHLEPGVRALLHHQAGRQGHRARPLADFRLRPAVGRRRRDRLDARPGHHRLLVPAALARRRRAGAGARAFTGIAPGRAGLCGDVRRRLDPGRRGRSPGQPLDRRCPGGARPPPTSLRQRQRGARRCSNATARSTSSSPT